MMKFEDIDFDLEKDENRIVEYEGQRLVIKRPPKGYQFIGDGISAFDINQGDFSFEELWKIYTQIQVHRTKSFRRFWSNVRCTGLKEYLLFLSKLLTTQIYTHLCNSQQSYARFRGILFFWEPAASKILKYWVKSAYLREVDHLWEQAARTVVVLIKKIKRYFLCKMLIIWYQVSLESWPDKNGKRTYSVFRSIK